MQQNNVIFWLLGLPHNIAADIENNLPQGCKAHAVDSVSSIKEQNNPLDVSIVFFTPEAWAHLEEAGYKEFVEDNNIQQVLVLDEQGRIKESEVSEMGSLLGFLYHPVTKKALINIKNKAVDIQELYTDLHLMAREIALERELLARKNSQLEFLNRILTRTSSLNIEEILAVTHKEISGLAGTKGLGAVFWKYDNDGEVHAEIYMPRIRSSKLRIRWKESFLAIPRRFTDNDVMTFKEINLSEKSNRISWQPNPSLQITIPLYKGREVFGVLMAVADETLKLGRDQLQIINSASHHLALAVRNALKFRDVKREAEFDGLTSVYSRQQFDKRIRVELKRHQRYAKSLSLIMLDLDFFKRLNDTYGHVAGDNVLKKVGSLLDETLRETDFPARFGGEEFVVILPETNEEQAWLLAERLRKRISRTSFSHEDNTFNVTASLGVASIKPGPLTPGDMLVQQADEALYRAKSSGRNMVCTSADLCVGEAILN